MRRPFGQSAAPRIRSQLETLNNESAMSKESDDIEYKIEVNIDDHLKRIVETLSPLVSFSGYGNAGEAFVKEWSKKIMESVSAAFDHIKELEDRIEDLEGEKDGLLDELDQCKKASG